MFQNELSIRNQTCPNQKCTCYQALAAGNISIHSAKHKRLRCSRCRRTWVIHRHQLWYGLHTDPLKIESAWALLKNGCSIRVIARTVKVSPTTVQRWKLRLHLYQ